MADLNRGQTFGATEEVTNTKLHNLVDAGTVSNIVRGDMNSDTGVVTIQAAEPSSPKEGEAWYDTDVDLLMAYNGTAFLPVGRGHVFTNNSGSAVAIGDVVILDTANATSVIKTTTANSPGIAGVCISAANDGASVVVITRGFVPTVTVSGATSIGDNLYTSTTG